MAIISKTLRLVYFDITKIGSSSVKKAFWELDTGAPFKGRGLARVINTARWHLSERKLVSPRNIHEMPGYQNERFEIATVPEGYETFTFLRDPAARMKSAWKDKINKAQFVWRGEEMDLHNEGLSLNPSFGDFIDRFEDYRLTSRPARVHSTAYSWHLGPDMGFYDHVFRLEDADALPAFLSERAGRPVPLPHDNPGGAEARDDRLSPAQMDRLFEITAPDYALLKGIYDPDVSRAKLEG